MATRFYFTSESGVSVPTITVDASWEASTAFRGGLSKRRLGSPFSEKNKDETSTSGTYDVEVWQFTSQPLAAQTISGTVKAIMRCRESNAAANFRSQMNIRVVSGDGGTVRGTLLAHDASALSNEWDATTLTNRKFPLNWAGAGATLTSVAAQAGDRIVVEIGYRAHNTVSTQYYGYIESGDASSTDCAENETDILQYNPWVEFSQNLMFQEGLSRHRGGKENLISPEERRPLTQRSVAFDGVNEYVTMGDVLGFERTNSFSISFWFKKPLGAGTTYMVSKVQASGPRGYDVYVGATGAIMELTNSNPGFYASAGFNAVLADAQWHHIVFTWNGDATPGAGGIQGYLDGIARTMVIYSDTLSTNTILNTGSFTLGQLLSTLYFAGSMDDVAVYSKKLSADEVKMLNQGYSPSVVASANLVGYWKMGDGDTHPTLNDYGNGFVSALGANDTRDLSGNGYHGSTTNMEIGDVVSDVAGGSFAQKSYLFGGTDEYVTMGDVLGFERNVPFSYSFWAKWTAATYGMFMSKDNPTPWGMQLYHDPSGGVTFVLQGSAGGYLQKSTTSSGLNDGAWRHFVVTYDGSSTVAGVKIWVNGADVTGAGGVDTLASSIVNTNAFKLGRNEAGGSNWYVGNLDEVSVYNRVLTAAEVSWIYNGKQPRDLKTPYAPSGLVAWWRLGEGAFPGAMTNMEAGDIGYDVPQLPIWPSGGVYANALLDEMDTSSLDQLSVERRQREDLVSELGAPSPFMGHGEYATFGLTDLETTSNAFLSERRPEFAMSGGVIIAPPEPGGVVYYKMRAQQSVVPLPGYVTWVVQDNPDFAGAGYSTGEPTPSYPMVPGSVVVAATWQE